MTIAELNKISCSFESDDSRIKTVQHVVATTRPVPTDVAMRVTSEFYTELVRGDSVQGAFDVASRTLRGLDAGVFVLLPAGADHTVRFLQ